MATEAATTSKAATRVASLEELITGLEAKQLRTDLPEVRSGMTVVVHAKIVEKGKVRTQAFEGMVIKVARSKKLGAALTVRRVASGVGVERTFFIHSPTIEKVEVLKRAKVRRDKLYYLRERTGRAAQHKDEVEKQPAATKAQAKAKPTGAASA